jgi:hypothetical protein
MSGGASISAISNKDDEELDRFGKKKLGNQQPHIRVHHCGSRTMHDEK